MAPPRSMCAFRVLAGMVMCVGSAEVLCNWGSGCNGPFRYGMDCQSGIRRRLVGRSKNPPVPVPGPRPTPVTLGSLPEVPWSLGGSIPSQVRCRSVDTKAVSPAPMITMMRYGFPPPRSACIAAPGSLLQLALCSRLVLALTMATDYRPRSSSGVSPLARWCGRR